MTTPQIIKLALAFAIIIGLIGCWFGFPKKRKQWLLAGVAILIAVIVAEALLRTFQPQYNGHNDLFEPDIALGWRFVPGSKAPISWSGEASHYATINEDGFRDLPFSRQASQEKTILCFGDSFVSNLTVKDSDVFTRHMEALLPNTSVLNLGVNGYGQTQEFLLMREQFELHDCDLAIVVLYLRNDFTDNINTSWIYPRPVISREATTTLEILPPQQRARLKASPLDSLRRLHVVSLVNHTINDLVYRYEAGADGHRPSDLTPPEFYLCARTPWEGTEQLVQSMKLLLLEMQLLAASNGIPILYVIAPSMYQVDEPLWLAMIDDYGENAHAYQADLPNKLLMDFATEYKLAMIDLLPALSAATKSGNKLYHPREQHWNAAGNEQVAKILSAYLTEKGWTTDEALSLE